jgi:hypothetical protein
MIGPALRLVVYWRRLPIPQRARPPARQLGLSASLDAAWGAGAPDMRPSTVAALGGHLVCCNKHRNTFEETARTKHHRQPFTEDGTVTVDTGDLKLITG